MRSIRRIDPNSNTAFLQLVCGLGEGVYYFLDQFIWLTKAGVLDKQLEPALARAATWAELVGYAANVSLNLLQLQMVEQMIAVLYKSLERAEPEEWVRRS